MGSWSLFQSPPADFPESLASSQPAPPLARARCAIVASLLVLCMIPRVLMAQKVDVLVPDGHFYIAVARHLEAGNFDAAFADLHLNFYPAILMVLHKAGMEWESAGKFWGVLMSVLVVLPLFGWTRRQFDTQVATVASVLYAVHPRFIESSPETFRDQTFWFAVMLSLYWMWRAATEIRWRHFLLAGVALTLAVHVRMEGWLLLIPGALWTLGRWVSLERGRGRLAAGNLMALAVIPIALVALNLTWLRDYPQWELGRFNHLKMLQGRHPSDSALRNGPAEPDAPRKAAQASTSVSPRSRLVTVAHSGNATWRLLGVTNTPNQKRLTMFFSKLMKAFDPVFGLLFLWGAWRWRGVFAHRSQQAVFFMNLVLLASVWIYLSQIKEINSRYFFITALTAAPYAALGLLAIGQAVVKRCPSVPWQPRLRVAVLLGLLLPIGIMGWSVALSGDLNGRRQYADLGKWILGNCGPNQTIAGPICAHSTSYYARSPYVLVTGDIDGPSLYQLVAQSRPRIVIFRDASRSPEELAREVDLYSRTVELGYTRIVDDALPASCRAMRIFQRQADRIVAEPPAAELRR